jgi:hypothetical protein
VLVLRTFLAHWDAAATMQDNLDLIRRDNLFGKASRPRVEAILAIFRPRYLAERGGSPRSIGTKRAR